MASDGGFEVAPNPTEEPAGPEEQHLQWDPYLHKGIDDHLNV